MKKKALVFLSALLLALSFLPGLAEDQSVTAQSEDVFEAAFVLTQNPDKAIAAVVTLEYDHNVFDLLPSDKIRGDSPNLDMVFSGIPEGYTINAAFRVRTRR